MSKRGEVKKKSDEKSQSKEIKKLAEERDLLVRTTASLEKQNRELLEKIKEFEAKDPERAVNKIISVSEYGKLMEEKNIIISDLSVIINNLTEEKNYKAQYQIKEEELQSEREINSLLQSAVDLKGAEIIQLKSSQINLQQHQVPFQYNARQEEEIRGLNMKIVELQNEVDFYKQKGEEVTQILLHQMDRLKFDTDQEAQRFQLKEKEFQDLEIQLRNEINELKLTCSKVHENGVFQIIPIAGNERKIIRENSIALLNNNNNNNNNNNEREHTPELIERNVYEKIHEVRERRDNEIREHRSGINMQISENEKLRESRANERLDNRGNRFHDNNNNNNNNRDFHSRDNDRDYRDNERYRNHNIPNSRMNNNSYNYEFENKKRKISESPVNYSRRDNHSSYSYPHSSNNY